MALLDEFFAEIAGGAFHRELGRLLGGRGVSTQAMAAAFPEDLDGGEEPFEGVEVSHLVFKDKVLLPRAEFFARLRRESDAYVARFPFMSPVVERLWRVSTEGDRVQCSFRGCRAQPSEAARRAVQRLTREGLAFADDASLVLEAFEPKNGAFMDGPVRKAESWRDFAAAAGSADGVRVVMTRGVMLELLKAPAETAMVLHLTRAEVRKAAERPDAAQRLAGLLLDLRQAAGAERLALPSALALLGPSDWRLEDRAHGVGDLLCVGARWPRQEGERELTLSDGSVLRTRLPLKGSPAA